MINISSSCTLNTNNLFVDQQNFPYMTVLIYFARENALNSGKISGPEGEFVLGRFVFRQVALSICVEKTFFFWWETKWNRPCRWKLFGKKWNYLLFHNFPCSLMQYAIVSMGTKI